MKKLLFLLFLVLPFRIVMAEETYWYSDGTLADRVSCTSGGDITTPSGPYKYGHRFVEWAAAPTYDMTTLDTTENSSNYNSSNNQWRVQFSYGRVIGDSVCSAVTQSKFNVGTPVTPSTEWGSINCYCRVIAFIPNGATNVSVAVPTQWAYNRNDYYSYTGSGARQCKALCLSECAKYVGSTETLRAALYGVN